VRVSSVKWLHCVGNAVYQFVFRPLFLLVHRFSIVVAGPLRWFCSPGGVLLSGNGQTPFVNFRDNKPLSWHVVQSVPRALSKWRPPQIIANGTVVAM
jgi:hypothetical protein